MSFVVARMAKMKADNLIGAGNHNQRKTKKHSNEDIDVSRSYLNYDLVNGRTENFKTDIQNYINENKFGDRAVRKDAVLINEWIITSDKLFFENLSSEKTKEFFETAKDYFANKYGEENIRYAIVHMDETTPHMHMGIVPFDENKKLSAKRLFNRESLKKIQEELPQFLQEKGFEIERGNKNSERKNLSIPEYKKMCDELEKMSLDKQKISNDLEKLRPRKNLKIDTKPTLFDKNKVVIENSVLNDLLKRASYSDIYHEQKINLERQVSGLQNKLTEAFGQIRSLEREIVDLRSVIKNMKKIVGKVDLFLHDKLGIHIPEEWRMKMGLQKHSQNKPVFEKMDKNVEVDQKLSNKIQTQLQSFVKEHPEVEKNTLKEQRQNDMREELSNFEGPTLHL